MKMKPAFVKTPLFIKLGREQGVNPLYQLLDNGRPLSILARLKFIPPGFFTTAPQCSML